MARQMKKNVSTEVEKEINEEVVKNKIVKPKKKFNDGDFIMCHSVIVGGLNVNCRSSNHYEFNKYGGECEIEYRDLVDLIHKHSDHIFKPRFVIDDEDFIEEFPQLKKFYAELYTTDDFKEILKLPNNVMKQNIAMMPDETKDTLKKLAATMVGTGEIDSISKVKALTEIFGANFNLLSELFSEQ